MFGIRVQKDSNNLEIFEILYTKQNRDTVTLKTETNSSSNIYDNLIN